MSEDGERKVPTQLSKQVWRAGVDGEVQLEGAAAVGWGSAEGCLRVMVAMRKLSTSPDSRPRQEEIGALLGISGLTVRLVMRVLSQNGMVDRQKYGGRGVGTWTLNDKGLRLLESLGR